VGLGQRAHCQTGEHHCRDHDERVPIAHVVSLSW
jgi:hypothetical protein